MFKTRLLSGIVLVVLMVACLYFGGYVSLVLFGLISVIGVNELLRIPENKSKLMLGITEAATLILYVMIGMGLSYKSDSFYVMLLVTVFLMVLMCVYVFRYPKYELKDMMLPFFTFFYVVIMLSYVQEVRMLHHGGFYVVLVFLAAWGNDTCAYCAGVLLGKHKMSPKLSPKKSVEGFIGGIVGAGLLGGLYSILYAELADITLSAPIVVTFVAICFVGGAISVVGDLAASAIKRQYGIKDYGTLIPGHGGIMDRFDSMIMTAPIVYYLVVLFLGK